MTIQANFPAIKPSLMLDFANTKQLDSRITYTRASTASYYDGVTTSKAEENQLTYSNEISTARWTGTGLSTTINNSTSPDGTTTATLLTATAGADSRLRITTTQAVSTTHTFSIYAKAGATSWLRLRNIGSNDCTGWFNLTTGAVGTVSGGTSAITSVGSGWYRCSITSTSAASIANNLLDIGAPSGDNTQASAGGETISVWGVQLEARSSVTALTVTTTQAITNYIPKLQSAASGVARFDNNPTTGESLGLLIEESRTNLVTYSAQFDNAAWTKSGTTITADTIVAPDGTLTGDRLVEDTANSGHQVSVLITPTNATAYTATVYVKPAGRNYILLYANNPGAGKFFDLANGTVLGNFNAAPTSASITLVGNGWYRCSITATTTSTSITGVNVYTSPDGTTLGYTGNGFSGVFLWGAQLEVGAFATSYIPTVASQVTRAADAASMTGTNFSTWFNQGQGSFIINAARAAVQDSTGSGGYGRILGNDANNNSFLEYEPVTNVLSVSGVGSYRFTVPSLSTAASVFNNMAVAYDSSGISVTANNAAVQVNSSARMRTSDRLNIFGTGSGAYSSSGWVKKIAYYPIKVTSTNMQALTS